MSGWNGGRVMKQHAVRFCEGCGQMFDDIQPEGGEARWIEAHAYLMKYGFHWDDLDRLHGVCSPCARVVHAAAQRPSGSGMETPS